MKNRDIELQYKNMASHIEDANIYDGRGTYDLYECSKCGHNKITTYADKGVTPFIITCKCGGEMSHMQTFKSVPETIYAEKWVRPTLTQTLHMPEGMIQHILNGGLVLESELLNGNGSNLLNRKQRRELERRKNK